MINIGRNTCKKANLLLVDDQPRNLMALEESLTEVNANFVKASSGNEALKELLQKDFAVIILDVQMPEMDGFETAKLIRQRERTRHIPIIFLTAVYNSDDFVSKGYSLGAVDYLVKPISPEILTAKLNEFIKLFEQRQLLESKTAQLEVKSEKCHQLNSSLQEQIFRRNAELQQVLKFEVILKHITDKVRDSLDEAQILQSAVQELAIALNALGCNAAIYDTTAQTSSIIYEYAIALPSYRGRILEMQKAKEIYAQLQKKLSFQFCSLFPNPNRGRVATLACPIHNGEAMGDLWLINSKERVLNSLEVQLVEQVASQCAIAIRQARLYKATQRQVEELEKLNRLKDDFLSTISHELRTPLASMQMAIQMLEIESVVSKKCHDCLAHTPSKAATYLKIIRQECERENKLLGDFLLLQHLEAGTHSLMPTEIRLQDWLLQVIEPFEMRVEQQRQELNIEIARDLPVLAIDIFSLERLLTELLTNAHKYTPSGKKITLTAQIDEKAEKPGKVELEIKVINSGVEIAIDQQSRIFDKFYRIPNDDPWKYDGTGLGLALVKRLAEYLGGKIGVTSSANNTCFTLTLPVKKTVAKNPKLL